MAAEQGDADAQFGLAFLYTDGKGVTQDYKKAVKWFSMAAEQGNTKAQFNLGLLYDKGKGVLEDDILAYAWYNLSAAAGNEKARTNRDMLKKTMSVRQIAYAQEKSKQLLAKLQN